ncbi:MAG: hypothetical protein QNJ75_05305 [Acidimicrobiia bacterium]|nr:hypothetical protein [Acidimicrobiia bacterium]
MPIILVDGDGWGRMVGSPDRRHAASELVLAAAAILKFDIYVPAHVAGFGLGSITF